MKIKESFKSPMDRYAWVNSCEYIIIHHTASQEWSIKWILKSLAEKEDKVSCHYVIDINWDIYKIWNDTDVFWHAGISSRKWLVDLNWYSIWIEIIWPLKDWWFTSLQSESLWVLLKELTKLHNIPKVNILRHKDISPWRKIDVSDTIWNKEFDSFEKYIKSLLTNLIYMETPYTKLHNELKEKYPDIRPIWDNFEKNTVEKEIANITFYTIIDRLPEILKVIVKIFLK